MKREEYIESKAGRQAPFDLPEGYFDSFSDRLMAALPAYPEAPKAPRLTAWQRIRPYIYMAAMFAGIWCMMKMFHDMTNSQTSLDAAPAQIAAVMADPEEYDVGFLANAPTDYDLQMAVLDQYDSFEDLRQDLGFTLRPQYD